MNTPDATDAPAVTCQPGFDERDLATIAHALRQTLPGLHDVLLAKVERMREAMYQERMNSPATSSIADYYLTMPNSFASALYEAFHEETISSNSSTYAAGLLACLWKRGYRIAPTNNPTARP